MMKEELCENLVEVRRISDIVMTVVVFEEDVLRLKCVYACKVEDVWIKNSLFVMS